MDDYSLGKAAKKNEGFSISWCLKIKKGRSSYKINPGEQISTESLNG